MLSPFTYFLILPPPPHSLSTAFCSKEKRAKIQRPKMTLNPLKRPHRDYYLKMPTLLEPPFLSRCQRSISLSFSLPSSLPLIFFQLRGADSPDTIIQLYCGTTTVAAVLCKGFPRMAQRAKQGLAGGSGTEQHRYKQKGWSPVTTGRHAV